MVAEKSGKGRLGVKARQTQPINTALPADQGGRVSIGQ